MLTLNFFISPAVWLLPTQGKYGGWPRSGEIDLLESRGNLKYGRDVQIGVEQVSSTLHFGPAWNQDAWRTATYSRNDANGYQKGFHKYEFVWDQSGINVSVDGTQLGFVEVGEGFWKRGGFNGDDIWKSGTKMAPFDEEVSCFLLRLTNIYASELNFHFYPFFSFAVSFHY